MKRPKVTTASMVLAALQVICAAAGAVPVHVPELELSFVLPDGFVENRALLKEPRVLQGFVQDATDGGSFGIVVLVERLGGTIGRGSMGASIKTRDGRTLEVQQVPWKTFSLDVVAVPERVQDTDCITLNVQVPLKPHAAQIKVFGELRRESELRGLLHSILETTEGPTNWLTEEESNRRLGEGVGRLTMFLGFLGFGIYSLVKAIRNRSAAKGSRGAA